MIVKLITSLCAVRDRGFLFPCPDPWTITVWVWEREREGKRVQRLPVALVHWLTSGNSLLNTSSPSREKPSRNGNRMQDSGALSAFRCLSLYVLTILPTFFCLPLAGKKSVTGKEAEETKKTAHRKMLIHGGLTYYPPSFPVWLIAVWIFLFLSRSAPFLLPMSKRAALS